MVARGAGAAGPVLLACRQWDPLGLARRLPSLGAGAWRCAPLLPWRVQCPVRVCAALAAGSGGSGRYLVLCLSRFPLPAPRVPRCVWRAVPSRCPLPSLAGTPFHAVCAFRVLGPVALLVVPACPLRVCALALPRGPLPPLLGGVACAPRAVPALGAGRAVPRGPCPSACPDPVPCSVWRAWGGAVRSRFPATWLGFVGVAEGRPRGGVPSTVARGVCTYDFSSCFFPKFKVMHFQNGDIKLYTVVLLFLCFLKILTKLCCRWSWSRRSTVSNCRVREFQIPDRRAQ